MSTGYEANIQDRTSHFSTKVPPLRHHNIQYIVSFIQGRSISFPSISMADRYCVNDERSRHIIGSIDDIDV